MKRLLRLAVVLAAALGIAGCSGKPGEASLRDSFASQLSANKFIKDFQRNGDELTFTGPGAEGGEAKWRVHIDSAVIAPTDKSDPDMASLAGSLDIAAQPYKGTVKSSWYSNGQLITPRNRRDSRLPLELIDNGVAQDCWALWDKAAKKWGWE